MRGTSLDPRRAAVVAVAAVVVVVATGGCALELDPAPAVIHARFDPDAEVVPMPTDLLRDDVAGRLDLPLDGQLGEAERELRAWLNTTDGWSSASAATVELDGVLDPETLVGGAIEVWRLAPDVALVLDARISLSADGRTITIDPPRTGWPRGGRVAILVRGGEGGARGLAGERLECDAAFHFLRLETPLDVPEHERAFPGDTAAERRDTARRLEDARLELAPVFDHFEARGVAGADVAAAWSFTVTTRTELAMDEASQRMPLPIDLLLDPTTGRVDLPPAPWDGPTVVAVKRRLAELDGFGVSAGFLLEATGPVDPATIDDDAVELWRLDPAGPPVRVPVAVALLPDRQSVEVTPATLPLPERSRFAIVVQAGLRAADGTAVVPMPAGVLLLADAPVAAGGASLVGPVADDDAARLEVVRGAVAGFLADRGDAGVLVAWTFTTMSVRAPLEDFMARPATLGVAVDPRVDDRQGPFAALLDFPLGVGSLRSVDEVVHGTIDAPVFLDPTTRGWRADGGHAVERIAFTATVPRDVEPGRPVPVAIFGHAIMTERRMVLAIGDALAARGIAAVAIDLPFHGTRAYCWSEGPLSIPDPRTGELTPLGDPCTDGTCREDGRCVRDDGSEAPLRDWPVLPMPRASGAAFLEIDRIANSRDHFRQAEIDLAALLRSLREGDWREVLGAPVDVDRIGYAGQSLGGILGGTFVALSPAIDRAVLNVPGADTVDMFDASPFFGAQMDAFFTREGVARDGFDGHRFLQVARWIMDGVDPQSVGSTLVHRPGGGERPVLLQMATLDAIIPNPYTRVLEAVSGAVRRDYVAEHGFLVIPFEPEFLRGTRDLASFLATGEPP